MKAFYFLLFTLLSISLAGIAQETPAPASQQVAINNFLVKEHILKNQKVAVIACNEDEQLLEKLNGVFQFTINGFKQELKFNEGVAIAPQQINESTFLYLQHKNDNGTHAKLFYVLKSENNLKLLKINWMVLIVIPIVIILIALAFRKLLIVAVIILILIFFFNSNNGLSISTFFDTIFDGLRSLL